jgi:predicted nucleic acid-binding protein
VTIVVDTSVLIDHLRGRPEARDALAAAVEAGDLLVGSVLTRTEVLAGERDTEAESTAALLAVIEWVPVTESVADRAGRLAQQFLRSHPGVDTVDYVIAATAQELGGDLWTRNVKHFPMYPGLTAPY